MPVLRKTGTVIPYRLEYLSALLSPMDFSNLLSVMIGITRIAVFFITTGRTA